VVSDSQVGGERTRILVLPDDLLGPELGESFLDRRSLAVRAAKAPKEAIAIAEIWHPHLIVFRSQSSAGATAELSRALRGASSPPPKLLMLTDRVSESLGGSDDAECDAHLISPVDLEQLLATVAELVDIPQRQSPRVPIDVLVHTEGFAEEGAAVDGTLSTALALSEDGMLLEASRQLRQGVPGRLQFFLPDGAERLTVDCVVRAAIDEVRLVYMVEFVNLPPQHRTTIRRYVESRGEAA
jgi:CheY-like chemotaxis protein